MSTVLTISDSVENTQFDLCRSISTIKDLSLDPLAVVPTFFRSNNSSESFDVSENLDYVFSECEYSGIRVGYLTEINVVNNLVSKLGATRVEELFVEPSLISDKGEILVGEEIYEAFCSKLAPISKMIIINTFEAELLAEFECRDFKSYLRAAKKIFNSFGCLVYIKPSEKTDNKVIFFDGFKVSEILPKVVNPTFDTKKYNLATAIVSFMVKGNSIVDAVDLAMDFCSGNYTSEVENLSFPDKDDLTVSVSKNEVVPEVTEEVKEEIKEAIREESNTVATASKSNVRIPAFNVHKFTMPKFNVSTSVVSSGTSTTSSKSSNETIETVKSNETSIIEDNEIKVTAEPVTTVATSSATKVPEFKSHKFSMPKSEVPKFSFGSTSVKEEEVPAVNASEELEPSAAESTSLVSASKQVREILRTLDKEVPDAEPAVTSAIEKPAPGPLGTVSDLATPGLRLKNDVNNSLLDLESLRNRLNSLTGSENK